jgi:hypothetical protein
LERTGKALLIILSSFRTFTFFTLWWKGRRKQPPEPPVSAANSQIQSVIYVPVNYAIGPVTALTARRVRYRVGPDLICQPGPSPGIKTHSSPAAFPSTLSLPLSPWTLYLPARALGRCRAPLVPCQPPPVPTEPIRRGQWKKCRSATAGSHSLDASAALSRRPSDPCVDP